ncbi:MAG: hypothetical protein MI974_03725 [Chitinophagales bacterium]|nr:hypothetical protein [Chitinophagales bacterium]
MKEEQTYQQIKPIKKLENLVHSFWMHKNVSDEPEYMTIVPDSYLKIVFVVQNGKVTRYFMTGLWIRENTFTTPPNAINYGCRLKVLAPEYLLQQEVASILQGFKQLDLSYLNLKYFDLSSFEKIVHQWQMELLKIKSPKIITGNKLRLSQLLDRARGDATAKEVSEQIFWTNRQINRYLNKYIGVSLKKYLNIQKAYQSYIQIREGRFFPENYYYDRAHFVREIKKHTGKAPSELYELQNDRFIQIKNIKGE